LLVWCIKANALAHVLEPLLDPPLLDESSLLLSLLSSLELDDERLAEEESVTGSAGGSLGGAASETAGAGAGAGADAGAALALELSLLDALFFDDARAGLKGGGATGPFPELSRVPAITCALIDCGGGK